MSKTKLNLFDVLVVTLVLLAGCAFFFTVVRPVEFSQLIKREGVHRYARVEILLADNLAWMREELKPGEELRNVYGELEWVLEEVSTEAIGNRVWTKVTAKIMLTQESSGLIRYGKYTVVKGSLIRLLNDKYLMEGRVYRFDFLGEEALL